MAKKKRNGWLKALLIIAGIIVVSIVVITLLTSSSKAILVTTSKVELRDITQSVSAVGKIEPETEVKISSETSGEIIFLGPKEGDTVRAGQIVVRIKPDIVETMLEQYKAAADASKMDINYRKAEKDRAQSELQRMTELFEKEYVSKQDFERAKTFYDQALSGYRASLARYDQSVATLKQFQRSADRTTIFSPMYGVVTKLSVERGENVVGTAQMQGTEMMRISDLGVMNAMVEVDENDIVMVKIGDTANIEIDAFPDRIFMGKVVEIGHSAKVNQLGTQDQVTNFEVKVRVIDKEPRLRPGMSCNVEIRTETRYSVLTVPLQAVTIRDTAWDRSPDLDKAGENKNLDDDLKVRKKANSIVFLREGNKAKSNHVETGISDKGYIEIKSGLKKGDEIISGGFMAVSKELFDGAMIKLESEKNKSQKSKKK